ncbi:MAG: hypothetical protein KDN19_14005 [Verrucomicrobiae bacterium]|nr:hypothetical protein [Verrucomicrobiae bacterium]
MITFQYSQDPDGVPEGIIAQLEIKYRQLLVREKIEDVVVKLDVANEKMVFSGRDAEKAKECLGGEVEA